MSATLEDHQIVGVISDGGRGLRGCHWGVDTKYSVFDIDIRSQYHKPAAAASLAGKLQSVGLQARIFQSSESGGWHMYIPFDSWENSAEVGLTLKRWLKALGYEIESGVLEVFPSGNALRLPLQPGFAWLDSECKVMKRREDVSLDTALRLFLDDLSAASGSWRTAKKLIEVQINEIQQHREAISDEGFDELFTTGVIEETYVKGRQYWLDGLTEANQRHEAVLCVEHYLWYGDPDQNLPAYPGRFNDETRLRLIRAWLEQKHNGFCRHISNNDWKEVDAQIRRACLWRNEGSQKQEPYPLTERALETLHDRSKATGRIWSIEDLKKGNQKRESIARKKIKQAVSQMLTAGQQVTRNALAARSGCSPNTVSKHRDLWLLLTTGSGDLNRGVRGGFSSSREDSAEVLESKGTVSDDATIVPPTVVAEKPEELPACEISIVPSFISEVGEFVAVGSKQRLLRTIFPGKRNSGQLFFVDFSADRQYRFLIDSGEG